LEWEGPAGAGHGEGDVVEWEENSNRELWLLAGITTLNGNC